MSVPTGGRRRHELAPETHPVLAESPKPAGCQHRLKMNLPREMNLPRALITLVRRPPPGAPTTAYSDVVRPMPRRSVSHAVESAAVTLPRARPPVTFKSGIIRPIG